jgi:small-conductance mechanosensitive channel
MTKEEQIKFLQDTMKSQLEFANSLKQLNQNNVEVQENIAKLEANIQLIQNKLELEKLVDD